MTRRIERFAGAAHRASRALAAPPVFAALAGLAACTDEPPPTGPARRAHVSLIQVASGPVVTSTADPGDGTCDDANTGDGCTLREAIAFADPGATITFAPGVTGTITLTQGELSIGKALTVSGPGAKSLAVSGNQASRVFNITGGVAVTLAGLTVTGGADGDGGGIAKDGGTLTITRCTVAGNSAAFDGGGIHNLAGALTVVQSTVSGNTAGGDGGGIFSSTLADLSTTSATVLNSTISGNTASQGGGLYNINGLTRVVHSTVTANHARSGGGLMSFGDEGARMDVQGSIVAGNFADAAGTTPNDVATQVDPTDTRYHSLGYNVIGRAGAHVDFSQEFNATGDQTGVTDPAALKLGALADNGGPTKTHKLLARSVALDAGDPAFDPAAFTPQLTTDQRGEGFARVVNGRIDVGAFEAIPVSDATPPVVTPTVSGTLGANGWYTSNVTVSWSVVDDESGVDSQTGCGSTTIDTDTNDDGVQLKCTATSAGGTASQSVTITRDATAPTLNPSVAPSPVILNGSATATPNANDNASGVASASCDAVSTGTVGTNQTVACRATDNAGNAASATASYAVRYQFVGFSAPVDGGQVLNVAKGGQTIPLKWQLLDAHNVPVTTLSGATVTVANLPCAVGTSADQLGESATGASGLQNLGGGYYQLNWQAQKSYAGSCKTLQLNLSEGSPRTALFQFTK